MSCLLFCSNYIIVLERNKKYGSRENRKVHCKFKKREKLTQEPLAEKLGVTAKSVSRWENGKTMSDISVLSILANELNCTIQELLNGRQMTKEELLDLRETINNLVEYESNQQIRKDKKI